MAEFANAVAFHRQGDLVRAENGYRAVLRDNPDDFDATYLLGLILFQDGRAEEAEAHFRRAVAIDPGAANAFHDLGNALLELKRPADALAQYDEAVALYTTLIETLDPCASDQADVLRAACAAAHHDRGRALRRLGRREEELASYQHAVALMPNDVEGCNNRGSTLLELDQPESALAAFDKAIALDPRFTKAHINRSRALIKLRRIEDALAACEEALALDPNHATAWLARGNCLRNLQRFEESLIAYDRALALDSSLVDARAGRARTLRRLKRHADAAQAWADLLAHTADYEFAKGNLAYDKMLACDWRGLAGLTQSIDADVHAGKMAAEPFGYQVLSHSAADLRRGAELYARRESAAPSIPPPRLPARKHDAKLRLGYVSGEFRHQATSILTVQLFELHDKTRFELIAFDNGHDDGSDIRRRINAAFDRIIDIRDISDTQAASLVQQNEIDILVNLNGFFGEARNGIFQRRAAPIQVSYLGFPGTMGAGYIDYIVADRCVIPPEHEEHYVEKVVRLPECYQVNDSKRAIAETAPTRAAAALPQDGFVFCCFNNTYKITPEIFEIWMRLLARIEGSRLWLVADNADAVRNLRCEASGRGVSPDRLVFASRIKLPAHLARHRLADLFVDTLPYNAHTTASDALWAGLPLLTCLGSTFPGRVAASLLQAVGLPELITRSLEDYESLALRLATEPPLLSALKAKLAQNRDIYPLFDSKRFARHIEAAYIIMYERARRGEPPAGFAVRPLPRF